mgnify:CR=1 FL=1
MTKSLEDTIKEITIIGNGANTGPSYTISASPWAVGSAVGAVTWSPNTWTTSDTFTIGTATGTGNPMTVRPSGKIELKGEDIDGTGCGAAHGDRRELRGDGTHSCRFVGDRRRDRGLGLGGRYPLAG